ncbi:MAG TPA: lipopolysaccharide biosynthesis protein, partial [Candidatus Polarisedimenticolia bacterium]|nr:lipopolysaccharide biosynthesis protein [Candidatus Polarisedimenticolia bacterium]
MSRVAVPLRRAAAGGVLWTASSQVLRQGVQLAVTIVLARHLAPADFGLIGMAAVTVACVAPLNEMGMGAALVQRRDLQPGHAGAVFWFQTAAAALAAACIALAAPWVALFFGHDDLVPLLRALCWMLPLGAMAGAPQALLLRDLRFGAVAAVETVSLAVSGAAAVVLAAGGWGVWSLVVQSLAGAALAPALMLPLSRFNPLSAAGRPRWARLRELARFSAPLTGYQILNFVARNLDDVLIGRFLGAEALGYYAMAYRVMMYPLQKVSGVIGRVSFPAFASMGDDLARIRDGYVKSIQYISLITFPMMVVVMAAAPELTRLLFGPGWDPVAPLVAVLSLAGMAGSIGTTAGSLFLARGRTDTLLRWEVVACAGYAAAIAAGLPWGLAGVAVAYTAMSLLLWPISHLVANRLIGLDMPRFFSALAPAAALASGLAAALLALRSAWPDGAPGGQ